MPGARWRDMKRDSARSSSSSSTSRRRVARFDLEVELLAEAFRELVGEIAHAILRAPRRALLDDGGELVEDVEVAVHGIGDARPLHLDDDLLTAVQARSMGLPDRRRRQ